MAPLWLLLVVCGVATAVLRCHPGEEMCQSQDGNTTCLSFLQTDCEDHKVLDLEHDGGPRLEARLRSGKLHFRLSGAEIPGSYQLDLSPNSSSCSSFILTNVHTPSVEVHCTWTNDTRQVAVVAFADALARSYLLQTPPFDLIVEEGCSWDLELLALVSGHEVRASFPQYFNSPADTYRISLIQSRQAINSAVTSAHSGEVVARFLKVPSGNYSLALQPLSNSTPCLLITTQPFSVGTPSPPSRIPMEKIIGVIALGVILVILFVLAWVLIRMFGRQTVKKKPTLLVVYRPVSEEYSQVVARLVDYLRSSCQLEVTTQMWDSFQPGGDPSTVVALIPSPKGLESPAPEWLAGERVILTAFKPGAPSPCPPKPVVMLLEGLPRLLALVHDYQPMFSWLKVYPKMPGYNYLDNMEGFSLHHTINKLAAPPQHHAKLEEEIPLACHETKS